MRNSELIYWVSFNHLEISPQTFQKLLEIFGTAKGAWNAKKEELEKLDSKLAAKIANGRQRIDPEKLLSKIQKAQIKILTIKDKNYPANLSQIDSAPYLLYLKGELLPEDENAVAVVGARKITSYGRQVTESLVPTLVTAGLTIVSGMARGVDAVAHRAALEADGRTIAVLGSGVDVIYPPENKKLYEAICQNGAVVSEFPPGTQPRPQNFPVRNRIIAGLSLGVLVTEAAEISGSLITAGFAGEFGREVFAVPGPVYSAMSAGTAGLIKDGAKLVYRAQDLLEELNIPSNVQGRGPSKMKTDEAESKILEILGQEPAHVDQIIKLSGLSAAEISAKLTLLEIKGVIKNLGGGNYGVKKTV